MKDSLKYNLLKTLADNPALSQRQLAKELGISLGKANYCLRSLIETGLVKAKNFHRSHSKTRYLYILTPHGLEKKAEVTARFLKKRLQEYETLKKEIEELRAEVNKDSEE
ncbi:MAG: MarR family EPS-associated transcriptional regulator [Desulfosalsimonas sp.]